MKFLPLLFLLASCSPSFYCKRCLKFGGIPKDTVFQTITVTTPATSVDTTLNFVTEADSLEWNSWTANVPVDTIRITNEKTVVKIKFLPGEKVYVKCDCPKDTVRVEVPVLVETEIKPGIPVARVWLIAGSLVILALVVGFLLGKIR